uniref:RNA-directed RNA polymerase n=1 Tax=Panagrellus redivivus TaxID=6233 RepID=A0A7E4ZUQ1_PANRE
MAPLQKFWVNKEPPERVERYPDFMSKDHRPFYQSNRLMGHVHRKIQQFVDSVGAFIDSDADLAVLDEYVDLEGWEQYESEAEVIYENFTEELQRLLMNFGIKNEAELFSQCFTDIKFRQLRNQESDNLSGFSTASLIQKHLYGILGRYRKEFFAEMRGGSDKNPQDPRTYLLTRFAHVLTSKLRQKAVAYYKVAYRAGNFLSFPWVVWDVIDIVRMDKRPLVKYDPRGEHLSAEIERITSDNYHLFILRIVKEAPAVLPYLDRYDGLGTMLHCLWQWKERRESLSVISDAEIVYIFMLYACGEMFTSPAIIRHPHELPDSPIINLQTRPGGLGRMLLGFFITISRDDFFDYPQNWLVTHTFGFPVTEDFCDIAKWRLLHAAARDTYFKQPIHRHARRNLYHRSHAILRTLHQRCPHAPSVPSDWLYPHCLARPRRHDCPQSPA